VAAAEAALRAVIAQQKGAQATLNQLKGIRSRPVALDAAVHKAEGQVAQAEAAVRVAEAALTQVQAPAQPEVVAIAEAKVRQADAGKSLVDATIEKLSLTSPVTGTVTTQMIHPGEVAEPGAPLLTVVDLEHVKLVIYVPGGRIGEVKLGHCRFLPRARIQWHGDAHRRRSGVHP
jgi:multidrug resistance efflux pump